MHSMLPHLRYSILLDTRSVLSVTMKFDKLIAKIAEAVLFVNMGENALYAKSVPPELGYSLRCLL